MAQFLCREGLLVYRDRKLTNATWIGPFLIAEDRDTNELQRIFQFSASKEQLKRVLSDPPAKNGYERQSKEAHFIGESIRRVIWGEQLAQIYSFKGHRLLLDVAGASGGISIGLRRHNPHLRCILFDLPEAEEYARRCVGEAGDDGHIRFVGGSFLTDDLPRGADVALLSNIIHNWPEEQDRTLLAKIHDALEPGGTLLVKEAYFEDDWTGPIEAVFQAFFMGRDTWQPTYGEVEEMMRDAGFVDLERRADIFGVVIGRKFPVNGKRPRRARGAARLPPGLPGAALDEAQRSAPAAAAGRSSSSSSSSSSKRSKPNRVSPRKRSQNRISSSQEGEAAKARAAHS